MTEESATFKETENDDFNDLEISSSCDVAPGSCLEGLYIQDPIGKNVDKLLKKSGNKVEKLA